MGDNIYGISSDKCTKYIDHRDTPTCQKMCPIPNTISKDSTYAETEEQLRDKSMLIHHIDKL